MFGREVGTIKELMGIKRGEIYSGLSNLSVSSRSVVLKKFSNSNARSRVMSRLKGLRLRGPGRGVSQSTPTAAEEEPTRIGP